MIKHYAKKKSNKSKKDELYETPYSMTRQLLEQERENIKYGTILEPACGKGAIVKVVNEFTHFGALIHSDLTEGVDFLKDFQGEVQYDTIITNPPYSLALEFIEKAKEVARKQIMFLLPLYYLHGKERYDKIYTDRKFPLDKVYIFTRYPMLGDKLREDGKYRTGMQAYAWFIWRRWNMPSRPDDPIIQWLDNQKFVLKKKETI